jgi:diguanylate cyclase
MVEVHEKSKDAKKLQDRIQKLSQELDQAESRGREAEKAFREVLSVLAGLANPHLDKRQAKKLKKTRKAFEAAKPDPEAMHAAVAELKNELLAGPEQEQAKESADGEDDVSRHIALALLEGLRLGNADFDAGLERDIVEIQRLIAAKQVRPAMVLTMDLMDRFRHALEKRNREAETAFKEVVSEVFKTEEAFAERVHKAQDGIMQVTREFDDQVTASMGGLAKALKESTNLETMKARAVEHLRSLREGIKARQEKEQGMLSATRRQLEQVRSNLGSLRERVRQAEKMSERLGEEALTDPLTKIWNKRAFSQRLTDALESPEHSPVSLIIFDIDNFKGVNDNYGHQAGDKALQAIADRASNALRRSDALFRYAGDEFAVILVQTPLDAAMEAAERIRQSTETIRFTYRGQGELRITVTLGVAQAKKGESLSNLFERADQALFEAKRQGRNRVGRA